ncbi:MAG: NYN domain-containing protein [Candidatus Omnitrophica bacterium]|nr:NYN domain-containing protein [Candidatus Omnitrophota bacterium]MDE2222377.1 NYN domain-containing protein [Candidatus Omnitrophota bacterium]
MSLHYLLDGYNVLKQRPSLSNLPLEEGRIRLLKWIEAARPHGSANNAVTVVFDGNPEHFSAAPQGDVRVIFAPGSADEAIKRMVEEDQERKNCVVVSDDKEIFLYARSLGAQVMHVAAFVGKGDGCHGGKKHPPADSGGKYIPLTRQENINKELRRLWLKEQ